MFLYTTIINFLWHRDRRDVVISHSKQLQLKTCTRLYKITYHTHSYCKDLESLTGVSLPMPQPFICWPHNSMSYSSLSSEMKAKRERRKIQVYYETQMTKSLNGRGNIEIHTANLILHVTSGGNNSAACLKPRPRHRLSWHKFHSFPQSLQATLEQ
jgi:hypothetical protein